VQLAKTFGGRKYMWDGAEYGDPEAAHEAAHRYLGDDFEVQTVEEDGRWFVYSRREVGQAVEATASE
jgi:hypothetical protein